MDLLRELVILEKMAKKFKIWFDDEDKFTVRYAETKDEALATLSDSDKDSVKKVEELT